MKTLKHRLMLVILAVAISSASASAATKPVKSPPKPAPKPVAKTVTAASKPSALFPARDDLRSGFIDRSGRVVISGYDETGDFSEGLAPVGTAFLYGFIDTAGKLVIPIVHHGVARFSQGLAPVYDGSGLWGYLDRTGNVAIKPQYAWAEPFSEGLGVVKLDGKYGAIDKAGNLVIRPTFAELGPMSGGLMAAQRDGKWGFVDKTGTDVIAPQFDSAGEFVGGLAPASSGSKWGYIDKSGQWIVQPKYAGAKPYSEGLAAVGVQKQEWLRDDEGRVMSMKVFVTWGYIDTAGKEVIALDLRDAGPFSEGLAPAWRDKDFGFIDKTGAMTLITPFEEKTGGFHSGLACTKIGSRYGFINETGKLVIPHQFWDAKPFSEGLAVVQPHRLGAYGYIDTAGRTVVRPQYLSAYSLRKGLARVRGDLKWGLIDKTGKPVLEQTFGELGWVTDKAFGAKPAVGKSRNLWGFYDRTGNAILEPQFESASFLGDGQAVVRKGTKYGVVDSAGKLIVAPEYDDAGWLFTEGLLPVCKAGKWGFIDTAGKVVIEPRYDAVGGFTPGNPCAVKEDHEWGFIGIDGKAVIPPQFDMAVCFSEGLAVVKIGELWGFVDKAGKQVIKPQFELAGSFSEGLAPVQIKQRWGYVDKTGALVIAAKYDKALGFENGLAEIRLGNQTGYINSSGKAVWLTRQYASATAKAPPMTRPGVRMDSEGMRVVKVKVAADQVFQQRSDWQAVLERRMKAVSDLMEKSFRVRLDIVGVVPWTTPDFKDKDDPDVYGTKIYDALTADIPRDDAEIVVGFTGRASRSTTLAFTHCYFDQVIAYDPYNGAGDRESQIVYTIAHEICHDFGAFHVPDRSSIMNAINYEDGTQTTFDEYTDRQMALMHDYDFGKSLDALADDRIRQAAGIYAGGHAPGVPFPIAKAHMYRGIMRYDAGDVAGAILDYREALRLDGDTPDFAHQYRLGKTLINDGQTVLGIDILRTCPALKTDPEEAGMWHNFLADDLANQLADDKVFMERRRASQPGIREIIERFVLTRVSPDEVISEYREAVKWRPKNASYQFKLGETLLGCGRLDEAIAAYEQAVALEPDNNWYQFQLGTAKAKKSP